jgi:hypothetical protein
MLLIAVPENRALRRIFRLKRDDIVEAWRKP